VQPQMPAALGWLKKRGGLACEAVLSESPVSIREAFPRPGAKRPRPKGELGEAPNPLTASWFATSRRASLGSRPFRAIQAAHDRAACPIGTKIIAGAAASLLTLTPTTCLWLFSEGAARQLGSYSTGAWSHSGCSAIRPVAPSRRIGTRQGYLPDTYLSSPGSRPGKLVHPLPIRETPPECSLGSSLPASLANARAASLFKPPKCCWRFGLHCSPKRSLHYGVFPQTPAALRAAIPMGTRSNLQEVHSPKMPRMAASLASFSAARDCWASMAFCAALARKSGLFSRALMA